MGRSDLVLLTGGLGPTQDDLTRETVADVLGLPLVPDEESLRRIEEYFRNTGREMTENNKKQAMLPEGCIVFPNDHGTAPGCAVERYGQSIPAPSWAAPGAHPDVQRLCGALSQPFFGRHDLFTDGGCVRPVRIRRR